MNNNKNYWEFKCFMKKNNDLNNDGENKNIKKISKEIIFY
jgi:hypothetical protein